ncbi:phage virion morphogenesis protein [Photobacterium frigidiphilum]|uniref:phage virion morphogenesis protein n=1 Tax=Photobacterium frigidiphilum TaxID=264736 RepID=UPI003D144421
MFEIRADKRSYLRVKEQLALIMLDRKSRKRILSHIGRYTKKRTQKNMRAQKNPDGHQWKRRQRGRGKMFKGLARKIKYFQGDNNRVVYIGWPGFSGYVAEKHHVGENEQSSLQARFKQAKTKKEPKKTDLATREQARALRDLGFRLAPQGRQKRGKKPTLKFITQNMTVAEAAKMIRTLDNKKPARKWAIERPTRRLIGISPKRVAMIIKRELNRSN